MLISKRSMASLIMLTSLSLLIGCSDDITKDQDGDKKGIDESVHTRVIYGDDNRLDLYEVQNQNVKNLARSTVALVVSSDLSSGPNNSYSIKADTFGKSFNLCTTERFWEQDSAAFCSGFLVAPNIVATAGHCIRDAYACGRTSFVFDYAVTGPKQTGPREVSADKVYSCNRVIKAQVAGADYSLVELDRPVTDRSPLNIRQSGQLTSSDELMVIGHPSGIPVKVAAGAYLRSQQTGYFTANLDTYGGNSGSAVINTVTGDVEGILVRGETDFVYNGTCKVSNVCENDKCRGEDVTKIEEIRQYLPSRLASGFIRSKWRFK